MPDFHLGARVEVPRCGDLLHLSPHGGQAFGFDGSTGATRTHDGFTSFKGLSEGFRQLRNPGQTSELPEK